MNTVDTILANPAWWRWDRTKQHEIGGLVAKAKLKDPEASAELLRRYTYLMAKTVRAFTRGMDNDAILDDLFSEAKLGLFEAIAVFDAKRKAPFTVLLRLVVVRHVIAAIREGMRHSVGSSEHWEHSLPLDGNSQELESPWPQEIGDPRQELASRELYEDLQFALDTLDSDERLVLELYHQERLPVSKIRLATGLTALGVKRVLACAEAKVRTYLIHR